jgi:hypothetical protein
MLMPPTPMVHCHVQHHLQCWPYHGIYGVYNVSRSHQRVISPYILPEEFTLELNLACHHFNIII